jgi:hypothetical protein
MLTFRRGTLRGCTIPTYTLDGDRARVQMRVYSRDDERPTMFAVYVLPGHYHRSTSFSGRAGEQVYCGESLAGALGSVFACVGRVECPAELRDYLGGAAGTVAP